MIDIVSPRLHLRSSSLDIQDISKQVEWLNDKHIMKWSEQRHLNHSIPAQVDYINSFEEPSIFLEIWLIPNKIIGTITAHVDEHNSVANMGILIGDASVRGEGLATEAWIALTNYLFHQFIVRKIEAGCMALNKPMISVFQKCGMSEEGMRFGHFLFNGSPINLVQYGKMNNNRQRKNQL